MRQTNGIEYRMIYEFHPCEVHKNGRLQTYPYCTCWGSARSAPVDTTKDILNYYKERFEDAWQELSRI